MKMSRVICLLLPLPAITLPLPTPSLIATVGSRFSCASYIISSIRILSYIRTFRESGAVTSLGSAGVLPVVGYFLLPAASIAVAVIVALAPIDPLGRLTV